MDPVTLEDIATLTGGRLLGGDPATRITAVGTDSRKVTSGTIFFALKGNRFDGHDYLGQAVESGAAAACVERVPEPSEPSAGTDRQPSIPQGMGVVQVENTGDALLKFAAGIRGRLQAQVIGITGSSGKTITKEMLRSILAGGDQVVASPASYNNEIGLPLTILQADRDTRFLVLEMGMRGLGQIATLARTALPDVGVITNIGESHVGLLGSINAIAQAKGELAEAIPSWGRLCINIDDSWGKQLAWRSSAPVIPFGLAPEATVRGQEVSLDEQGRARFRIIRVGEEASVTLPFPGIHQVANALAAAAAATALGRPLADIIAGLENCPAPAMRMEVYPAINGATVINDAYNANPSSTRAALSALAAMAGRRRLALLGEMRELGEISSSEHRKIGEMAGAMGLDYLFGIGEWAADLCDGGLSGGLNSDRCLVFSHSNEVIEYLRGALAPGDLLLVKASRAHGLDEVAEALRAAQ